MLIPKSYVTKLIGSKGCMIQDIASESGGATIKILSNKKTEKENDLPEIIVSIAGSLGPMQDAACLIVEQMEVFKNGGPVLTTGKAISQNIVSQFKNSIFFSGKTTLTPLLDNHDRDKFISKKRYRSNSRDYSRSDSSSDSKSFHDEIKSSRHHKRIRSRSRKSDKTKQEKMERSERDRTDKPEREKFKKNDDFLKKEISGKYLLR